MLIPTFFSRTDQYFASMLANGKTILLGVIENQSLQLYRGKWRQKKLQFEQVDQMQSDGNLPVIIMLNRKHYRHQRINLSGEEYVDPDTWIDLHMREIIPPGFQRSAFELYPVYKPRKKILDVYLVSSIIKQKIEDAVNHQPYSICITGNGDKVDPGAFFTDLFLSKSGMIWLRFENSKFHPITVNIRRWAILILTGITINLLFGFAAKSLFSQILERKQKKLASFSNIQKEHEHILLQIKREQSRFDALRSFARNPGHYAEKIDLILREIPEAGWVDSYHQKENETTLYLYFMDIGSIHKYQEFLEKLPFIKNVNTNMIISANPRKMKRKYGILKKKYRAEVVFSWS